MNTTIKLVMRTVVVAAAAAGGALALATPASAAQYYHPIGVSCPPPLSQSCPATGDFAVPAEDPLFVSFRGDPAACADVIEHISVNGVEVATAQVGPGTTDQGYYINQSDIPEWPDRMYHISIRADGVLGGCNTGSMSGWSGTLHVETGDDA